VLSSWPLYPELTPEQQQYVAATVANFYSSRG
jgi:dTDP-4-amino-4,6-dideoxygalactose transaminase